MCILEYYIVKLFSEIVLQEKKYYIRHLEIMAEKSNEEVLVISLSLTNTQLNFIKLLEINEITGVINK